MPPSVPNEHSEANPAVVVGNVWTPSTPTLASSAAVTCSSRWVSTPPVIGPVSTMVIVIPAQFYWVKGWDARPGKETVPIGCGRQFDRSPFPNGACPYLLTGPTDTNRQTGPQADEAVNHH
jgi:hypothetical protein